MPLNADRREQAHPRLVRRAISRLTAIAVLAFLATAAVAFAAQFGGPSRAGVGAQVTFQASGLTPGSYTLRLVKEITPDTTVAGTDCAARVGRVTKAVDGDVQITAALPTRLACSSGAGPIEGHYTARPGKYLITISRNERGLPFGGDPFLRRALILT